MKKNISIILIFALCLLSIPSFAASTVAKQQNFDDMELGEITSFPYYNWLEVFDYPSIGDAKATIQDDGFTDNCLHIKQNSGTGFSFCTDGDPSATEEQPVYAFFKMKIINDAGGIGLHMGYNDNFIYINYDSNGKFLAYDSSSSFAYELNKWYDVSCKFEKGSGTLTVTDGKNTCSVKRNYAEKYLKINNIAGAFTPVADTEFAIDEVFVLQCDSEDMPQVNSCTPADGTASVSRKPTITVKYDKPISGSPKAVLTDSSGVAANADYECNIVGFNTVEVKVKELLEPEETYTLSLTGLTNVAGTGMEEYTTAFTTEFAHLINAELDAPVIHNAEGGEVQATVVIDDPFNYGSMCFDVLVATYRNNEMTNLIKFINDAQSLDGKLSLSFYLPKLQNGENAAIMLFENTKGTFIPVCKAVDCEIAK